MKKSTNKAGKPIKRTGKRKPVSVDEYNTDLPAINTIDNIRDIPVCNPVNKLTVPVVAYMLSKNYSQADIARTFGLSRQAVNQFISKHDNRLSVLKNYDQSFAWMLKDMNVRILQSIDDDDIKRSPFGSRILASSQTTDKIRLLEDKSTSNIAVRDVATHYSNEINRIAKQREEIMQQLGMTPDTDTSVHDP